MKVLFINEAQGENIGDQAIYCGVQQLLIPVESVTVSQLQLSLLPIKSINNSKVNNESRMLKACKSNTYIYGILLLIRLLIFNIRRFPRVFNEIKNADLIVFGGGSLLIDNKCVFPVNLYLLSAVCRFLKKPYGLAGVSTRIIERKFPLKILKRFVERSEFRYFRDKNSISICSKQFEVDAKFMPDFALCLTEQKDIIHNNNLAINIMGKQMHGYFSNDDNHVKYLNSVSRLIVQASKLYNVTLFTTGEKSDEEAVLELIKVVREKFGIDVDYISPKSVDDLQLIYQNHNMVFATRLHSAIIGLAKGCKVICFNWDSKVSGFFDSLNITRALVGIDDDFFDKLQAVKQLDMVTENHYNDFIDEVISYEK